MLSAKFMKEISLKAMYERFDAVTKDEISKIENEIKIKAMAGEICMKTNFFQKETKEYFILCGFSVQNLGENRIYIGWGKVNHE